MRSHLWIVVALAVAACSKKDAAKADGKAGATSGEAAVRGFVEGVLAKDAERARRFLPDDASCDGAPPEHRTPCTENSRMMRAQVESVFEDFPAGSTIKSIAKSADETPDPSLGMWEVKFAKGEPVDMMTVQIGQRYYAAFAIRKDDGPR